MRNKIAILGAGNMGLAIADGILRSGLRAPEDLILVRRSTEKLAAYRDKGCTVTDDVVLGAECADVIILAVKPQMMNELFYKIADKCEGKLAVSIAAGIKISTVENALAGAHVVRAMPNTPLTVGCGVTGLCRSQSVSDADFAIATELFNCSGTAFECREEEINALTALTSSAVAYFAAVEDAMCEWALKNGFEGYDRQTVCDLVSKTQEGSAKLLYEKRLAPKDLIRSVASPNGTTERALRVFDEQGLYSLFSDAMTACLNRAEELSGGK